VRWGLTQNAYEKYKFIFDLNLPAKVKVSSKAQVTYIRDVMRFAAENDLKGKDFYGKVKATVIDNDYVRLDYKINGITSTLDMVSVFDILDSYMKGKPMEGDFNIQENLSALDDVLETCEGLNYKKLPNGGVNLYMEKEDN